MANGIRTGDPRELNKGRSSKFREGSRVWQTPEEGRRTYRPKRCGNNNKDEDISPKTLNNKNRLQYIKIKIPTTTNKTKTNIQPNRIFQDNFYWILWHITHFWLFNVKSFFYTYKLYKRLFLIKESIQPCAALDLA